MPRLSPPLLDTLEHWFDEDAPTARSINYAVFDRSGILFYHAIGEAGASGERPGLDTVYRIASMSKSFEAAAVLILRDRGLLALDDRVSAHIPQFIDPMDAAGVVLPVTIRMLLSNRSGLPEDNGWADHHMGMGHDEFLELIGRGLAFTEKPDGLYQYSNIAFWLAGIIVEKVSGRAFTEFVSAELLDPLGLTGTHFDVADYAPDGVGAGIAEGFSTFDKGESWFARPVVHAVVGASGAGMFSTLPDIARWSFWLASAFDPENVDDSVLTRSSRREMQFGSAVIPPATTHPPTPHIELSTYGLGLVIDHDQRFGAMVHHSGGLPGWSSNMRWHPESGLGVAVFINTNGPRPGLFAAGMLRAVLADIDAPAREITLQPSTLTAALAIENAIVSAGDVALPSAASLYSDNVLNDVPAEVRRARLAKAVAEVGGLADTRDPITERLLWSVSAAQVTWLLPGRTGDLQCRIELTPTTPALVQRIDIEKHDPESDNASVVRRYRPLVSPE
ncbi:serine hydrolase domain-containing protein [Marisediminicola senii]|uniref:serine hydrolase domain-containing protein n=1 Tax=Marisediminicola senii TaxID=2711233 RepID=UPI0013EE28D1|nr:serine hydrolase domain-containing protein [Marisediminicola senii]